MQFVYIDEAGISSHEPHVVVAGAMVRADTTLVHLENYLEQLVEKHIPENDRDGFVFHMTDIWSGQKYFKDRDIWTLPKRIAIIDDLVAIPAKFDLVLVMGWIEKSYFKDSYEIQNFNSLDISIAAHAVAHTMCVMATEKIMREQWPEEVAQLVVENNEDSKRYIKETHSIIKNKDKCSEVGLSPDILPLQNIRGTIHWVNKDESQAVQVADTCAFIIRRHLSGKPGVQKYYDVLKNNLAVIPKTKSY